ncbi:hypothetical protein niasHS_011255 [Heterodera schachtii]|uniref:Uncharacterized protein n=2 Tax=Heterodera TaxID=34509 RepID=A0ABD2J449_HETSC
MPSPCHIFTLGDEICVLNSEGMFSKLVEESVENKLDIFIARRGKSEEMLKSIFMKYGDYLYFRIPKLAFAGSNALFVSRSLKYRSAPLSGCLFAGC